MRIKVTKTEAIYGLARMREHKALASYVPSALASAERKMAQAVNRWNMKAVSLDLTTDERDAAVVALAPSDGELLFGLGPARHIVSLQAKLAAVR